jgi:acyl-CoA synthetase (AMP-forming)/AMP-acid ligase II
MTLLDKILDVTNHSRPALTTFSDRFTRRDIAKLVEGYESLLKPLHIKGKRVGLLVPSIQEYLSLLLAVNHLGGTVVPLSWQFRKEDLTKVLDFLDPHIIFSINLHNGFDFSEVIYSWADNTKKETLVYTSDTCLDWNLTQFNGGGKPLEPEESHFICCTSGSTGTPKGLIFNEKVFDFSYKRLAEFFELKSTDTVLFYLSTSTIFGIKSITNGIKEGANVIAPTVFDLPAMINVMKHSKCNKVVTTPSVFKAIHTFAKHLSPELLENLELVCLTGEKMPDSFPDNFPTMKNCRFVAQYGISETGAIANSNLRDGEKYTLVTGVETKIVDEELFVKTGALLSEYYSNKQLTTEAFDEGWFKTGDLVEFIDDSTFNIVGRKKDMIKKGGQQVIPNEVEVVISAITGVKESKVIGSPHSIYGEQVVAFVVAKNISSTHIRSQCKGKISSYKIPDKIIFLDNLPITQGKVDKLKLKSMANLGGS